VLKALLRTLVLTRHNKKHYKVDNIDWEMSPGSKFVNHNGEEKSFVDYYKKHYVITIKDEKQPMLINRAKKKTAEEADVASIAGVVSSTNMSMNRWYSSTCNKHFVVHSGVV
jgi:aubergine-like protein